MADSTIAQEADTSRDGRIAEACRRIAGGEEPEVRNVGLCRNVTLLAGFDIDDYDSVYDRLDEVFVSLGLSSEYPLGRDAHRRNDYWFGEFGEQRRDLARRCADYLDRAAIASATGGAK